MQTTKNLIKILPFEEPLKTELLRDYDTMNPDQRFAIEGIVWDVYDALYETRLEKNMQLAFERARKNEEKLDQGFYDRVRQQTEQQLQADFNETAEHVDLSTAREELEKIITQTN